MRVLASVFRSFDNRSHLRAQRVGGAATLRVFLKSLDQITQGEHAAHTAFKLDAELLIVPWNEAPIEDRCAAAAFAPGGRLPVRRRYSSGFCPSSFVDGAEPLFEELLRLADSLVEDHN